MTEKQLDDLLVSEKSDYDSHSDKNSNEGLDSEEDETPADLVSI